MRIPVPTRLFFINTGVITPTPHYRRRWEANKEYGFVSAGQHEPSGRAIRRLRPEDLICAYISKHGYVGIGRVIGDVKPIGESFLNTPNPQQDWPLINHDPMNGLYANMGNEGLQEYIAKIKWLRDPMNDISTAIINPYWPETLRFCSTQGMGFKIYPGVSCILDRNKAHQENQIKFIEKGFDVLFI